MTANTTTSVSIERWVECPGSSATVAGGGPTSCGRGLPTPIVLACILIYGDMFQESKGKRCVWERKGERGVNFRTKNIWMWIELITNNFFYNFSLIIILLYDIYFIYFLAFGGRSPRVPFQYIWYIIHKKIPIFFRVWVSKKYTSKLLNYFRISLPNLSLLMSHVFCSNLTLGDTALYSEERNTHTYACVCVWTVKLWTLGFSFF